MLAAFSCADSVVAPDTTNADLSDTAPDTVMSQENVPAFPTETVPSTLTLELIVDAPITTSVD